MAKYTTEVRSICEVYAGLEESAGQTDIKTIIAKSREKIFNFEYPIFDESYRSVLETKILKHYYTREIGEETVGLWKLRLDTRMNEIMPFYNQLYKSELLEFNPMYDVDYTIEHKGKKDETKNDDEKLLSDTTRNDTFNSKQNTSSNVTATTDKTGYDLYSDTPQGSLVNINNETYLTNATKTSNNGTNISDETGEMIGENTGSGITKLDNKKTNSTVINNLNEYLESVKGKRGGESFSEMLVKYRETFVNIDVLVINELKDLFINLW